MKPERWLLDLKAAVDQDYYHRETGENTTPLPTFTRGPKLDRIPSEALQRGTLPAPFGDDQRHLQGLAVIGDDLERWGAAVYWEHDPPVDRAPSLMVTSYSVSWPTIHLHLAVWDASPDVVRRVLAYAVGSISLGTDDSEAIDLFMRDRYDSLVT